MTFPQELTPAFCIQLKTRRVSPESSTFNCSFSLPSTLEGGIVLPVIWSSFRFLVSVAHMLYRCLLTSLGEPDPRQGRIGRTVSTVEEPVEATNN